MRHAGALIFLALIPALTYAAGAPTSIAAILLIPTVLVGAELLWPDSRSNRSLSSAPPFRLVPSIYVALQLVVIAWGVWFVSLPATTPLDFAALVLSIGIMTGIFGALAAHELIHSHEPGNKLFGIAMLFGMSYPHFRVAHIYGHHRHAATLQDPTTARSGESFYRFVPRAVGGQLQIAWQHEMRRAGWSPTNRVLGDLLLLAALLIAIALLLGPKGVAFFLLQSVFAILALELFNYVAHYGLVRGAHERFTDSHSWNASHTVGNALLFNMGRHSDHHRRSAVPYQALRPIAETPELPAGYAGSMLLALIPPLWRKVMDRRIVQRKALPAE